MGSASTSGIIFADLFVNSKEMFINYFTEYYNQHKGEIDAAIMELSFCLESITSKKLTVEGAQKFQETWNKFQKVVLHNSNPLQLMVGYRDASAGGKNVQFSALINQDSATIDNMIDTGSQAVRDAMALARQIEKAQTIEDVLKHHLNGYIDQLYYHHLNHNEVATLATTNLNYVPDRWKKKYHLTDILTGQNWQDIYYSNYYTGQGLGQAYDAFMNHVGNHHKELFNYLNTNGVFHTGDVPRVSSSVYGEEMGVAGNFPRLLSDSLNHTGWYTGGDIVIVDPKTMSVIYNIQLKTTQNTRRDEKGNIKYPTKFEIAISNLKKIINGKDASGKGDLTPLSQLSPREKAERLFEEFKTSISNWGEFDNAIDNTINNIYKKVLPEKLNITLKI